MPLSKEAAAEAISRDADNAFALGFAKCAHDLGVPEAQYAAFHAAGVELQKKAETKPATK